MAVEPSISLLLPTRGRPHLVKQLFESIVTTTKNLNQIEIILYMDDDDVTRHEIGHPSIPIHIIVGPKMTMGAYNTACLKQSKGRIIALINDDMVMKTQDWDEQLIKMDSEYPDRIYLAYPNDAFNKKWGAFPILSRETCELLVEPYPLEYKGAYIDTHLHDIFNRLKHAGFDRMRYLEDVVFEHLHFSTGKSAFDETYRNRGRFADDHIFVGLKPMRSLAAQRLICAIKKVSLPEEDIQSTKKPVVTGLIRMFGILSRYFLFDDELPLYWRGFFWYRFMIRFTVARWL